MHYKRTITLYIQRICLHLKSIGVLFWVPIFIFNLLVPLLNYLTYSKYAVGEELYTEILKNCLWYYPFFSNWWPLFLMKEYLETDGNELLFVYSGKNKLIDLASVFLLNIINILIWFIPHTVLFPMMKYELLRVLTICFLYFSFSYFLTFLSRSILIPLMILLLYNLGAILYAGTTATLPIFYINYETFTPILYLKQYFPFLIAAFSFLGMGIILNKKISHFN